jgi:hypothetical protein
MRVALLLLLAAALFAEDLHPLVPGLTIGTPAGWSAEQGEAGTVVFRAPLDAAPPGEPFEVAAARARASASIAVAVDGDARAVDAKAVMDAALAGLDLLVPDFVLVEPAVDVQLHGRAWQRARYRFATGEVVWEQLLYAGAGPGGGICITCSSTREAFPRWEPVFVAALATVGRQASRLAP